jgi:hypothetical protein
LEFHIDHEVVNEKYPPIAKSKSSYIPYVTRAWLYDKLGDVLPYGLKFGMDDAELAQTLGEPTGTHELGSWWERVLDPDRDVILHVDRRSFTIQIAEARKLKLVIGECARTVEGLFVSWALHRGLLNEDKFKSHGDLLEKVRKRKARGSELVTAAIPRGLWDVHLKDLPGLRTFAREWSRETAQEDLKQSLGLAKVDFSVGLTDDQVKERLHNRSVVVTLKKRKFAGLCFGQEEVERKVGRKSEYVTVINFSECSERGSGGFEDLEVEPSEIKEIHYDEAYASDDDWATVEKVMPALDRRFAKWVK